MKLALLTEWPSIDAKSGEVFSDWEKQVIKELADAANFRPSLVIAAHPVFVSHWKTLFVNDKIGGQLNQSAQLHVDQIRQQLHGYDVCLTMGSHAMYVLTGQTKIDQYRGTHIDSPFVPGLQVVPTYSPALFARSSWGDRPIVVSAMKKATERYVDKQRIIYVPECVADLYEFSTKHIKNEIVADVETNVKGRITDFGISPDSKTCLYIPLETRGHEPMWSAEDELGIFMWLHFLSVRKDLTWIFHNATYDLTYLDAYGIRPRGPIADTMLRHHAYQPEFEKSLGFLASLYIPGRAWKQLRQQAATNYNKAGAL